MSADLLEAFVGSKNVKGDPKQRAHKQSSKSFVEADDIFQPESTWQPWPTATGPTLQWPSEHQSQNLWETDQNGRDVLFDASQLDTDPVLFGAEDEFGDFEEVPTGQSNQDVSRVKSLSATADLLGLDDEEPGTQNLMQNRGSPSRSSNLFNEQVQAYEGSAKQQVAIPVADIDDEWGDFETIPASDIHNNQSHEREMPRAEVSIDQSRPLSSPVRVKQEQESSPSSLRVKHESSTDDPFEEEPWDDFGSIERQSSTPSETSASLSSARDLTKSTLATDQRSRPINVPPPAVLLAWLPKVFAKLASQSRQPNVNLSCGAAAVQAYRVSARIIAGRAARWKRDTILAQSMRIGAAGRSGGMKLTTLDKGESRKEDQAAEDIAASWTQLSHTLNAAIAKAKVQKPPMALSSKLAARTATGLDVVSATYVCAICGLRRNERVVGIDVNLSDTFGEFWVEHWGHRECSEIWYAFNNLLEQR